MSESIAERQLRMLEADEKVASTPKEPATEEPKAKKQRTAPAADVTKQPVHIKASWETVKEDVNMKGRVERLKKKRNAKATIKRNVAVLTAPSANADIVKKYQKEAFELLMQEKGAKGVQLR
ncbi:hypothetical protein DIPPA_09709 [Diplonema papillatum]|nr:hypothetical protein DIPPA_09709 [Diplonema papillatum]|eukprot:gene8347-12867_t